jgi:hypothetical protein
LTTGGTPLEARRRSAVIDPGTDCATISREAEFSLNIQRLYAGGPVALHAFLDRLGAERLLRIEIERLVAAFVGEQAR